jgi:hypothetical protein
MRYWAETEHLALDDDGRLWLRRPAEEDDVPLGLIGRAETPEVFGVPEEQMNYELDWLRDEWADAPDPAELREEARFTFYGGLLR